MFIKLTRFDNSPIWLNASFIVTVEPRKNAPGSIVVPIGDGLDYEVREAPEAVLAMLGDIPPVAVVPVPAPQGLTLTPDDVSPDPEPSPEPPVAESKPVHRTTAKTKKASEGGATTKKPRATRKTKKVAATLSDEQIEKLRRMAPGSVRKLQNTLVSQFGVSDADTEIAALSEKGVLALEQDHVNWSK